MIGDYDTFFAWQKCVRTGDGTTGSKPKSYEDNGNLWGNLLLTTAIETTERGAVRNVVTGQARLSQYPTVSALDRLVDVQWNDVYFITGIRRDNNANETICDLERYEGVS